MREITQVNIRNQGVAIAEVRGALQALAAATFTTKEQLQARIKHFEEKLANIQNNLTEIEWSESLEWLEDKAGIEA
jgi:DNA-binding transcriptional MerR regulator